jgi:hypothetical protein
MPYSLLYKDILEQNGLSVGRTPFIMERVPAPPMTDQSDAYSLQR